MDKKDRIQKIIKLLKEKYPNARTALHFTTPLEILIATMLSAQCTDERVNKVTRKLFRKYRKLEDYANADLKELEQDIKPTGFYKNKAKNIKNACRILIEKFDSKVPKTMNELMELPGVARKTANIVLSNAYGRMEGIAVDTHVRRLSHRLGLSESDNPKKIEQELMKITPKKEWQNISNLLILHGREVCNARKPRCEECILKDLCPSARV